MAPTNTVEISSADISGNVATTIQARAPLVEIGGTSNTNLICTRRSTTNLPSIVGLAFLRCHQVAVDYPNRRISLRKIRDIARNDHNLSGMGLKWQRGVAVVATIEKGGPASKAGLEKGDEILRIDDEPIWKIPKKNLYGLFQVETNRMDLMCLRGTKTFKVTLKLNRKL